MNTHRHPHPRGQSPRAQGARVASANPLFDELDPPDHRYLWQVAAAVALVGLLLLLRPGTADPETREVHTYRIEESRDLGPLKVLLGRLIDEMGDSDPRRLDIFTINPEPQREPVSITLEDDRGHTIEVLPAGRAVPARSVQHRVIDVGSDFRRNKARIKRNQRANHRGL